METFFFLFRKSLLPFMCDKFLCIKTCTEVPLRLQRIQKKLCAISKPFFIERMKKEFWSDHRQDKHQKIGHDYANKHNYFFQQYIVRHNSRALLRFLMLSTCRRLNNVSCTKWNSLKSISMKYSWCTICLLLFSQTCNLIYIYK